MGAYFWERNQGWTSPKIGSQFNGACLYENKITVKIPRGRHRQRWNDAVKKPLKKVNPYDMGDMGAALDKEKWKGILETAIVLNMHAAAARPL